jgi:uncharacterized protein (TIGR03083 family)
VIKHAATNDTVIRDAIADEYRQLADALEGLPSGLWDAPTLCVGWRVREVVAHLTLPVRSSKRRFLLEVVKARGNIDRMFDRCARRDAMLPTSELVAALRDDALHAWKPPGGGHEGALIHQVIHALDITVPLGLDRRIPEERMRIVLDGVTQAKSLAFFGADLDGIELQADDVTWTFGSGTPLAGSAQNLALVVCGRRLPPGRARGVPGARFTAA